MRLPDHSDGCKSSLKVCGPAGQHVSTSVKTDVCPGELSRISLPLV